MKPEEVLLSDWMRIFFGEVPAEFYLEIIIRCGLIYLLLQLSMRGLGKRMAGQLSRLDLTAMVSLASAIGVPMISPINGILPCFIIAAAIVSMSRLISYLSVKSEKFERAMQGKLDTLVLDGVLQLATMKKVRVTRDRLFAQLRSEKIHQLGNVDRLYMEADGKFSLVLKAEPKPGLNVLPDWDNELINDRLLSTGEVICQTCGAKPVDSPGDPGKNTCKNCGQKIWTEATIEK